MVMSEHWLVGMVAPRMVVSTLIQIYNPEFIENAPNKKQKAVCQKCLITFDA